MRFIVTSSAKVEQLKKQAKKLQRTAGGKHTELLDRVARSSGYDHWHHVVQCLEATAEKQEQLSLHTEAKAIISAAVDGIAKCVMTGTEASASTPFVLFSTANGDAWLLEPDEGMAACLCWHGDRREVPVRETTRGVEVEWDGTYELLAEFFHVETTV